MKRLVFILLLLAFPFNARAAVASAGGAVDVVLLIDVSGSMTISDADRAMPESVNALIDRVAADGGRVGIVTFSGTLKYILPISDLSDEAERESVKLRVSRAVYNGYTDIGSVLLKSAELLDEQEQLNNPMVVLFTDGMIEINPNTSQRTPEQSYNDTLAALSALDGQADVYAIGLDSGDRVDRALLTTISGGEDRNFITADAASLPQLFQAAYESHITPPGEDAAPETEAQNEPAPEADGELDEENNTQALPAEPSTEPQTTGEPTAEPEPDETPAVPAKPTEETADEPSTEPDEEAPTYDEAPVNPNAPADEEPPWRPSPAILVALVVLVLAAVIISARSLIRLAKGNATKTDEPGGAASFDITVSTPLGGDKIPTVSLEADIGEEGLSLTELTEAATGGENSPLKVNTEGLTLYMKKRGGQNALMITGKAVCEISDSDNTILAQKKIWWKANERLTFLDPDMTKLEITYTGGAGV